MRFLRSKLSWSLFLLGIAGFAVYGGNVLATPPSGLNNLLLARGTDQSEGSLPIEQGTDIVVAQITVSPGGSSGWHTHPGGAIIVINKGSLTVYKSRGSNCEVFTYSTGQAFIERPGEIDDVVNTGSSPYVLLVTFPRVPVGGSARIDVPDPGTCPGL